MSRWYRAYEGTVTDAKLAEVALLAGCSRSVVIATWHATLENAASVNDGGRIDTPTRRIAAVLCEKPALIEEIFGYFENTGLIVDSTVAAWKKRQYESDNSTERSRKHRKQECNADATLQDRCETPGNADATPPETETETEKKELSNESLSNAVEVWNAMAAETELPRVQNPSPTRLKALHFRLKEIGGIEGWSALMEQIRGSPHLLGQNDRGWRASFDWILKPANLTKVMEGNYLATDRSNSNGSQRPNSISDSLDAVIVAFDRGIAERQGNSAAVAPDAGNVSRFQQSYAAHHGGGDREAG